MCNFEAGACARGKEGKGQQVGGRKRIIWKIDVGAVRWNEMRILCYTQFLGVVGDSLEAVQFVLHKTIKQAHGTGPNPSHHVAWI